MTEPVLEVKSLNVRFIDENGGLFSAGFNSSFAVNQGEVLAIVGESGSGKSVTALSLLGLINPKKVLYKSTNSILFEGRELTSLSENEWQDIRGNEFGMVFQEPMSSLNPLMKVGEQVAEVIRVHKRVSEKKARARARYLLRSENASFITRITLTSLPSPVCPPVSQPAASDLEKPSGLSTG